MIKPVWTSDVCRTVRAVISEKMTDPTGLDQLINSLSENICGKPFFRVEDELGTFLGYMYFDGNQLYVELRAHMMGFYPEVVLLKDAAICEIKAPCCDTIMIAGCNLLLNGIPIVE